MIRNILMVIGSIVFSVLAMLAPLLLVYAIAIRWMSFGTFLLCIIVLLELLALWAVIYDEGTKNE